MVGMYDLPFYAGEDIKEEDLEECFCDKKKEVKEIAQSNGSKAKQHAALVGKRRIGKSSLMVKCRHELRKGQVTSIFVRVEKVIPFTLENFFIHLLREVDDSPGKRIVRC